MSLPQEFWKGFPERTDEQLFEMLAHSDDYVPEALAAAREELLKRNLSPQRISQGEAAASLDLNGEQKPDAVAQVEDGPSFRFFNWSFKLRKPETLPHVEGETEQEVLGEQKTTEASSKSTSKNGRPTGSKTKRYYLLQHNKRTGPFTDEELEDMYRGGKIDGDSPCCGAGDDETVGVPLFIGVFNWGSKPLRVFFPHFRSPNVEKEQKARNYEQHEVKPEAAKQRGTPTALASPPPPKENTLFYYKVKGEEKGPYTLKQLTSMWENGHITADALHRTGDSSEWLPLLPRFSEPQPLSQPTKDSTREQKEQKTAPDKMKASMNGRRVVTLVVIITIASFLLISGLHSLFRPGTGGSSSSLSSPSRSHKSARQLIREYAEALHGRNADIQIDGGYAGGAYTVTVSDHVKFHTYTYAVEVNEGAQEITAWQLTSAD